MTESPSPSPSPSNTNYDLNDDNEVHGPRPLVREVLACQFSSWYPTFSQIVPLNNKNKNNTNNDNDNDNENENADDIISVNKRRLLRKNVTIPSVIIKELPAPDFKNYLLSDGVKLPQDASKLSSCAGYSSSKFDEDDDTDDGNGNDDDDDDDDDDGNEESFHFPELNQRIMETIKHTFPAAGAIIPKLNWSAPRDATWINEGTMKCRTPGDVYLLLKSSDFCTHDVLYKSIQDCRDYNNDGADDNNINNDDDEGSSSSQYPPLQLVLRKWCNLNPSMEFRCFIRRHELLGISQRQHSVNYPHLKEDKDRIYDLIYDFLEDYVLHRFCDGTISDYVVDVFLDKKDRIWIVDFNPWARTTDSLLYEWSELTSMDNDEDGVEPAEGDDDDDDGFRIAGSAGEVRQDPLSSYRAPIDTVDLASMTHGDAKQFEEFMKLCQRPTYWEDGNSDDDDDDGK